MRRRIEESLARLASGRYQHRFVSEATADEYVLPDEILDSTTSLIETTLKSKTLTRPFDDVERHCLANTVARFRNLQKDMVFDAPEFSVEHDERWVAVREIANHCLSILGFDLGQWETENVSW